MIDVYVYAEDGLTLLSSGSITVFSGSWSLDVTSLSPSIALAEGYVIKATATAPGKATSFDNCDAEVVFFCAEDTPAPTADEIQKLPTADGYQITTNRPAELWCISTMLIIHCGQFQI